MGLLLEATVFLAAAVVTVPIFKRIKLGLILGYLAAGALIGPSGTGLIHEPESVLHFAEIGVVFFLFLVGLELEPARLWAMRRSVFGGGLVQIAITTTVLAALSLLAGLPPAAAGMVGFGLSLSSTALALQLLAEKGEMASPPGRASFGVLLFQDIAVIPALALVPVLAVTDAAAAGDAAAADGGSALSTFLAVAKALGVVLAVGIGGRYLVRPVFRFIAQSKTHEIFTAAALLVVLGTGTLMQSVGMSMALGAFLAGVVLADSEYRHELEADIEPFKGLLLGLFFIAVGMSANLQVLVQRPLVVVGIVVVLMAVKGGILLAMFRLQKHPLRSSVAAALSMSQGGEFGFVLFGLCAAQGILDKPTADLLVVCVSLSMAMTPVAMLVRDAALKRIDAQKEKRAFDPIEEIEHPVVIAGFGRYGQIIARLLNLSGIGFTALEVNPEQVDFVRRFGNKIFYGDASRIDLLRSAKADKALAFVLAIDDIEASIRTAEVVRRNFPDLPIYARARNRHHVFRLMDLGITVLNRETFHSSLKMAEQVLIGVGVPAARAARAVVRFAEYDEGMLREQHTVYKDEAALISMAKARSQELREIFENDALRRDAQDVATDTAEGVDSAAE